MSATPLPTRSRLRPLRILAPNRRFTSHCVDHGIGRRFEKLEDRVLLAADLIAHWSADVLTASLDDGAVVTEWTDSTSSIVATAIGSPTLSHTAIGGRAGIQFQHIDEVDLFRVPSPDSPMRGADDFTVAVVFSTSSTNNAGTNDEWFKNAAIVDASSLGLATDWGISMNSAGQVATGIGAGFGKDPVSHYSPASGLNDGQTHLAIFSRSGSQMSLQIDDGAPIVTDGVSSSPLSNLDMTFGAQKRGTNSFFGFIADVRIYNAALDQAETTTLHNEFRSIYSNQAPQAVSDEYTLDEDPILFLVTANDGLLRNDTDNESDPLTAVLVEPAANGRVTLNADGSFFYDPAPNFFGTDSFKYSAVDFRPSAPATVTLNVRPVYDRVTTLPDNYKTLPTQTLTVAANDGLLANDNNPDVAELSVQLATDVDHGQITLNSDGSFTYDPQGFSGEAKFTYQVDDGKNLTSPQSVSFTVNTPPVATSDSYTLNEDATFAINNLQGIGANDTDADGNALSFMMVSPPSFGEFALNDDGSFLYIPNQDYFGEDTFEYNVTDGIDESATVTVQLTVNAVNDAPVASADGYVGLPGEVIERLAQRGVLANDVDVDSPALSAVLVRGPQNGTLDLKSDGSFTYSPNAGFLGDDSFAYQAHDGSASSESSEVRLTLTTTPVVISEFMAINANIVETRTYKDSDGQFYGDPQSPDWIELNNLVSEAIDLGGMRLTDNVDLPAQWVFPAGTIIPPEGFLIIFASGEDVTDPTLDESGHLHTNFSLREEGEYLALSLSDGTILSEFEFPQQRVNVSYGQFDDEPQYMPTPTPGTANEIGIKEVVADTTFSLNRGFYTEPITVEISTETAGATIVYTTDGSDPTLENGTSVAAASANEVPVASIEIASTTNLRAAAFLDGRLPTNIDTNSYLFTADLVANGRFSRQVEDNPEWFELLDDSMLALPAVSLTTNGRISERESLISVEFFEPDGSDAFQIDAGVEYYGGHSLTSPKKNMRLSFKKIYGDPSLKHDLFGDGAVDTFQQLLLRTGSHDTFFWTHPEGGRGNYTRTRWSFERQREMGHLAPHGRYVNVYIDGQYEGMHNLMERPNADFMASYLGGSNLEYDALNAGTPVDGDADAWRAIRNEEVIDDYEQVKQYIDVQNYADYMLLQFFAGNDWDWNTEQNWMAARKRETGAGYIFFAWDSDVVLRTTPTANVINRGGPGNYWNLRGGLKQHQELTMLMADRAHEFFFNGGMFTDERLRSDIDALADEIRVAIVAETGRWGGAGYTPDDWAGAIEWMKDTFAPEGAGSRAVTTIDQMKRAGIYPDVDAPEYSVNSNRQHGGDINSADKILIGDSAIPIYFTTDGSDPRLEGGLLNPAALQYDGNPFSLAQTATIKSRAMVHGEWSALSQATFRINTVPADANNLRITELNYHPADPNDAEKALGIADGDDFEFIELKNISNSIVDLTGLSFQRVDVEGDIQGIDFDFAFGGVSELQPGEYVLVVEDLDAFQARYGSAATVAGEWNGALGNAGETISLFAGDQLAQQFAYSDQWFSTTDGGGYSLQILNETADPSEWSQADGWRASSQLGGSPGSDDTDVFSAGDSNRDGIFNSSDLVLVFQAGEYEDGIAGNSTWEDGDWNGDGEFNTADLVFAFTNGNFVAEAIAASFVNKNEIATSLFIADDRNLKMRPGAVDQFFDHALESEHLSW